MKRIDLASLTTEHSPLPWLSANETAALQRYCDELVRAVSREHIKSVILYGSKARGDAHPHSDLDLLVILDPGDEAQRQAQMRVDSEVVMDYAVPLAALVTSAQESLEQQQSGAPLMQNIFHDGIILLGEEFQVNPIEQNGLCVNTWFQPKRDYAQPNSLWTIVFIEIRSRVHIMLVSMRQTLRSLLLVSCRIRTKAHA